MKKEPLQDAKYKPALFINPLRKLHGLSPNVLHNTFDGK